MARKSKEAFERNRQYCKKYYAEHKANVIIEKLAFIDAYGGVCACCGDDHFEFLTADHLLGNGAEKGRNGEKFGYDLYRSLRMRGYPKDEYRLLCISCNFSFGRYGYCPHQFEQKEYGLSACG